MTSVFETVGRSDGDDGDSGRRRPLNEACSRRLQYLRYGFRHADVITLPKINTDLAEETSGLLVRNELGDGLLAHSPCDADDGRNHELVHGACGEAADEVAVDLEVVKREALEVVKGSEARAEVVQGESAAPAMQSDGEGLCLLDI